jgi:hypothetical protein
MKFPALSALALVLSLAPVVAAAEPTILFNGKSLDGWVDGNGKPTQWVIEDGALARVPKTGYIWHKDTYGDFLLELEFKVSKGCNSGVFIRTNPKDPVQKGFEIQVMDSAGKATPDKHDAGALYDASAPSVNAVKPAGEWNSLRIEAQGSKLVVILNDQKVQALDLDQWTEAHKNPDGSKNKFGTALKDLPREGRIGFQDHGHPVWYRNIRIQKR